MFLLLDRSTRRYASQEWRETLREEGLLRLREGRQSDRPTSVLRSQHEID
jgi:hypothetical protein